MRSNIMNGLRKKESYNEIINELETDPIKHYPNRKASELENSPYLSQLAGGEEEITEAHNALLKEKLKDTLLQQYSAANKTNLGL
jgi:hypothetical protein